MFTITLRTKNLYTDTTIWPISHLFHCYGTRSKTSFGPQLLSISQCVALIASQSLVSFLLQCFRPAPVLSARQQRNNLSSPKVLPKPRKQHPCELSPRRGEKHVLTLQDCLYLSILVRTLTPKYWNKGNRKKQKRIHQALTWGEMLTIILHFVNEG